jgi:hypothetical protein
MARAEVDIQLNSAASLAGHIEGIIRLLFALPLKPYNNKMQKSGILICLSVHEVLPASDLDR